MAFVLQDKHSHHAGETGSANTTISGLYATSYKVLLKAME
jgi:hypothetical protein